MPKVLIEKDTASHYFLWDEEVIKILPQPDEHLSEVPEELIEEYNTALANYNSVQNKLRSYYDIRYFRA